MKAVTSALHNIALDRPKAGKDAQSGCRRLGKSEVADKRESELSVSEQLASLFRVAQLTRQSLPAVPAAWQSRSRRVILDQQCEVLARLLFASRAGARLPDSPLAATSLSRPAGWPLSPWKLSSPL
jgi:hypothetical protein